MTDKHINKLFHNIFTAIQTDSSLCDTINNALDLLGPTGRGTLDKCIGLAIAKWDELDSMSNTLLLLANSHIHARPFDCITLNCRVLHQVSSLIRSFCLCTAERTCNRTFINALHVLDESLIVTGFPFMYTEFMEIISVLHALSPRFHLLKSVLDHEPLHFDANDQFPFVTEISSNSPNLLCFDKLTRSQLQKQPVVMRSAICHWPAMTKWSLDYLINIAGHRLVPVEIGRSYLDEDWSQKLMTMYQFISEHVISMNNKPGMSVKTQTQADTFELSPGASGQATAYLAQHDLFHQIPQLRSDICVPDELYYFTPTPYRQSSPSESDEANSSPQPRLNAWFGPAGTLSPLHHDHMQRNLFAQVKGSKRIILFPPSDSVHLADMDGLLTNSSSIDVRAWDTKMYPQLSLTHGVQVICNPGDLLYIPVAI